MADEPLLATVTDEHPLRFNCPAEATLLVLRQLLVSANSGSFLAGADESI